MSKDTDAYFINSSAFEATDNKVHVIARYAKDDVLRSGWLRGEDKIKDKIALAENAIADVSPDKQLSGADLESILLSARRKSLLAGRDTVQPKSKQPIVIAILRDCRLE